MIIGNVKSMETLKKAVNITGHICMLLQIIILTLVFICTLYIIFGILNNSSLEFLTPFMEQIKTFVISIFGDSIKESQDGIDGRLVLFILAGMLLAFFVIQLRMACGTYSKVVDQKIVEARQKEENEFNKHLAENLHKNITSQKNFLLAIQIRIKSLYRESLTTEVHTDEDLAKYKDEAINKFVQQIRTTEGITLSGDGEIILISANDVEILDGVVTRIWNIANKLKAEYRNVKIGFRAKVAVDVYSSEQRIKDVFKLIRPLLDLNATNEVLCFGNFRNRYQMLPEQGYNIIVKGQYELGGEGDETVWSMVKKD